MLIVFRKIYPFQIINETILFREEYIWLFVFDDELTTNVINELCKIGFGLDTDITIARQFSETLTNTPQPLNDLLSSHHRLPMDVKMFKRVISKGFKIIRNNLDEQIAIRISLFLPRPTHKVNFIIEQLYKIRENLPHSCVINSLGISTWLGFLAVPHLEVESRKNFYKFDFRVGILEYAIYQNIEEDMSDEEHAIRLYMSYFLDLFNAT